MPKTPDYGENPFMGWGHTNKSRRTIMDRFIGTRSMFPTTENVKDGPSSYGFTRPADLPQPPQPQQMPAQPEAAGNPPVEPAATGYETPTPPRKKEPATPRPGPSTAAGDYLLTNGTRNSDNKWRL